MQCRHWLGTLLACCALAATSHARADPDIWQFDPAQSHAEFSIRVMWLIPLHGRFSELHGTINIDRFRSTARVEALIDVGEVHMRSKGDEAWVKSAEFFDAQHFPQIQFVSDSFSLARLEKGGAVAGLLTMRGVARRAEFEIEPSNCAAQLAHDCPVEASGTIRRSDFDMRSRRGVLSDKVDLDFSIRVLPAAAAP